MLDGVYRRSADGTLEFVEAPAPSDEALQAVLHRIIARLMRLLTRREVLVEEEGSTYVADNGGDSDEARTLRPLQAAACTCRIAFGPRAGQKVLTVQGAMPRQTEFKQTLCADINGNRQHAAVRCAADDRDALEQLCRTVNRPTARPQISACIQRQIQARRALRPAPVLPYSGCRGAGTGRLKSLSSGLR